MSNKRTTNMFPLIKLDYLVTCIKSAASGTPGWRLEFLKRIW